MPRFVDHLQLVPVPSRDGRRQPDGDHRPGGLGSRTLADRLEALGWTARQEDMAYEKPVPERRLAEAYARGIGDAVLSAWDRSRFPIVLTLVNHGALGVVDALGPEVGLVWVSPRAGYRSRGGLLRRPSLEESALALVTGRARRDEFAVAPRQLPGARIVLIGGQRLDPRERDVLGEDGIRIVPAAGLAALPEAIAAVGAGRWAVHVDVCGLRGEEAPAADETGPDGLDPEALGEALARALRERELSAIVLARYDLNRDRDGRTADTLAELLDRLLLATGGQPRPGARRDAASGVGS